MKNAYEKVRATFSYGVVTSVSVAFGETCYAINGCRRTGTYYTYQIKSTTGNTVKTLATDVADHFITNGRYLFYAKCLDRETASWDSYSTSAKYAIYRLGPSTNTRKRLVTCEETTLFGAHGDYLYYGAYKGLLGADAYALNVKSLKRQ